MGSPHTVPYQDLVNSRQPFRTVQLRKCKSLIHQEATSTNAQWFRSKARLSSSRMRVTLCKAYKRYPVLLIPLALLAPYHFRFLLVYRSFCFFRIKIPPACIFTYSFSSLLILLHLCIHIVSWLSCDCDFSLPFVNAIKFWWPYFGRTLKVNVRSSADLQEAWWAPPRPMWNILHRSSKILCREGSGVREECQIQEGEHERSLDKNGARITQLSINCQWYRNESENALQQHVIPRKCTLQSHC